jgi:hypothetical protein
MMILYRLRVDPESDWHLKAPESYNDIDPRDFVLDAPAAFKLIEPGKASLHELLDALTHQRWTPLVDIDDPVCGPYSRCITMSRELVDAWLERGFRMLTDAEVRAVRVGWRVRAGLPAGPPEQNWFGPPESRSR